METIEKSVTGFFNSTGFKLGLIAFLTLLLLIPTSMILDLIRERQQRKAETVNEITSIWGNAQTITGPVLTIPYETIEKDGNKEYSSTSYAHFLPENLSVKGTLIPEERKRGIYHVITYAAKLHVSGSFIPVDFKSLNIPDNAMVRPGSLDIGITDMRGINKNIQIKWGDSALQVIPGLINKSLSASGVHAAVAVANESTLRFSYDIDLSGSESINFVPLGKETNV